MKSAEANKKQDKIALAMITKGDCGEMLDRCLATVAKWVDGIFVTITYPDENVIEVVEKYGGKYQLKPYEYHTKVTKKDVKWFKDRFGWDPHIEVGDKIFQFDKARNASFDFIPDEYDWVLWMDVDDVFRGGKKLREVVDIANKEQADSVFFNYLYQVTTDEEGNIKDVVIQHIRERLVRRGVYKWVAPIHETLIAQRQDKKIATELVDIVHLSTQDRLSNNITRNAKTLELNIVQNEAKDPRPIYYLGKVFIDRGLEDPKGAQKHYDKAMTLFDTYLFGSEKEGGKNRSGWAAERAQCWRYIAEIQRSKGSFNNAVKAGANSLIEDPFYPENYIDLALTYVFMQEWKKAEHWLALALQIPKQDGTLVSNPREMAIRAHEITYHTAVNTNNIDRILESSRALLELQPKNEEMVKRYNHAVAIKNQIEATKRFTKLAKYLIQLGEGEKLKALLASAPKTISNNPFVVDLFKQVYPPRTWGDKEVAIFCGAGFTQWSPAKIENPEGSFIGGSEEAVIYVSKELADLGWKVTVYNDCGDEEGEYDGVQYVPYYKFNPGDEFNIVIAWRNPAFADNDFKIKQLYIWMHDIINPMDITEKRLEKITKIFVLSPWHRTNIPNVPDDKIVISANGLSI